MVGQFVAPGTPILRVHGARTAPGPAPAPGGSSCWPASARSTRTPRSRCACWSTSRSAPCRPRSTIPRPPSRRWTGSRGCSSSCTGAIPGRSWSSTATASRPGASRHPRGRTTWSSPSPRSATTAAARSRSAGACTRSTTTCSPRSTGPPGRASSSSGGCSRRRWPGRSPTRRTRRSPRGPTASASVGPQVAAPAASQPVRVSAAATAAPYAAQAVVGGRHGRDVGDVGADARGDHVGRPAPRRRRAAEQREQQKVAVIRIALATRLADAAAERTVQEPEGGPVAPAQEQPELVLLRVGHLGRDAGRSRRSGRARARRRSRAGRGRSCGRDARRRTPRSSWRSRRYRPGRSATASRVCAPRDQNSLMRSARMIRPAASISARCEKACGKLPRWRPVPASNSSA